MSQIRARKILEFQLAHGTGGSPIWLVLGKCWFALLVIYLADNMPDALPIGRVRMKSYLPKEKIYLSGTMGSHFCQALAKLAAFYCKRDLQHDSVFFFPLSSHFLLHFCLGMHRDQNFEKDKKVTYTSLGFFFFTFPFYHFLIVLLAVIDLLLGLVLVQKFPREDH